MAVHTAKGRSSGSSAPGSLQLGEVAAQIKGEFRMPESELKLEFKNAQGQPVDVGEVKLALNMNMPGMVMHDTAQVKGARGHYTAKVKPKMAGDWVAKLSFDGPVGTAEKTFPVSVK